MPYNLNRRRLVRTASGLLLAAGLAPSVARAAETEGNDMPAVTPPEDLMREHGVLNRVLLIYDAGLDKFARAEDFDVTVIARAADIVREFIEGYHERNEEQQVFPRFRQAGKLVNLVDVLYQQHQAGRRLTDNIIGLVRPGLAGDDRSKLIANLQAFIRMYRPHEAREDTELFPQLRKVVSPHEFDAMAEDFERDEHRKFGADGFEMMVDRMAALEKALGIHDLAQVTPS